MPKQIIARRVVGGYMWRDAVERCLRLLNEDAGVLKHLINTAESKDALRAYSALLTNKVETITLLNELLRYSDKDKDKDNNA